MRQDSIQDFIEIPGVIAVALIQGRVIPYFYVNENYISYEEKIELVRLFRKEFLEDVNLQNSVEIKIKNYYAYLFHVNSSINLLVVTGQRNYTVQLIASKLLVDISKKNTSETIEAFKILSKSGSSPPAKNTDGNYPSNNNSTYQDQKLEERLYTISEWIAALNSLSQAVSKFLGEKITANFWNMARPDREWLHHFRINASAEIEFDDPFTSIVTPLQHLFIREWTNNFINQCSQIIKDLPAHIDQKIISEVQRTMISVLPRGYLNTANVASEKRDFLFD